MPVGAYLANDSSRRIPVPISISRPSISFDPPSFLSSDRPCPPPERSLLWTRAQRGIRGTVTPRRSIRRNSSKPRTDRPPKKKGDRESRGRAADTKHAGARRRERDGAKRGSKRNGGGGPGSMWMEYGSISRTLKHPSVRLLRLDAKERIRRRAEVHRHPVSQPRHRFPQFAFLLPASCQSWPPSRATVGGDLWLGG